MPRPDIELGPNMTALEFCTGQYVTMNSGDPDDPSVLVDCGCRKFVEATEEFEEAKV